MILLLAAGNDAAVDVHGQVFGWMDFFRSSWFIPKCRIIGSYGQRVFDLKKCFLKIYFIGGGWSERERARESYADSMPRP